MNIVQEGILLKWTNYLYGWKKRYFVLHDGVLEYCKEKGNELKGKISLYTLDVKKHPKEDSRLIINTGTNTIHLKAQNPKEAQEWFLALKRTKAKDFNHSQSISNSGRKDSFEEKEPITKSLTTKVGELWTTYALISESIDSVPYEIRIKCPDLEKLLSLCNTFKMLASESLSLIESEEATTTLIKNSQKKGRMSETPSSITSPKGLNSVILEDNKFEENE